MNPSLSLVGKETEPAASASGGGGGGGSVEIRLSAVETRLSGIESNLAELKAHFEHAATREDVANLKVWVLGGALSAVGIGVLVTLAILKIWG